jgi:hypothetical protein
MQMGADQLAAALSAFATPNPRSCESLLIPKWEVDAKKDCNSEKYRD